MEEMLQFGELAKDLKKSKEDITLALESNFKMKSIEENIYAEENDDKSCNILESLSTNVDESKMIINKITINKLVNNLDSRDKQIILLRYFREKTQMEVAKILGISQVQVSRIEKKILSKMKNELAS